MLNCSNLYGDSGIRSNARARSIMVIELGEEDLLPSFRMPLQLGAAQSDAEEKVRDSGAD